MKVLGSLDDARALNGVALALGNFDGVHLGHRALFRKAAERGRPGALTFEPHPGKVLQPELAPRLITPLPRKLQLLEAAGLDVVVVLPFTLAFARTSARDFEALLFDRAHVRAVVVGRDYTYGAQRAGTVDSLQEAATARGAVVAVVEPVTVGGVVASSSRIREYILEGRVAAARALLGRAFDLDGTVVKGDGRGRSIGWPTANVDSHGELLPASGVYAVRVRTADGWHGGAANIGTKPTFGGSAVTVEVHLLDWSGDLYGLEVRVEFLERLRPERRFGSVSELTAQIQRDVEATRVVLARTTSLP
ncbi:MAG TPA: bifunctional riboflavin kinase/FAD synthetase [Myxococcaceae bacterium]|nr:bifunctional riboflavin kinase/FAD synthetase [Myxococcaceae bacterium]